MTETNTDKYILLKLPQYPETPVLVTFFTQVTNSAEIKNQLVQGNTQYNYSFIDASCVTTLEQLFASIYKTLQGYTQGTMKAKTINSELILNLSPFTGIMDSFKKIGITEKTNAVIACRFLEKDEKVKDRIEELCDVVVKTGEGIGLLTVLNDETLGEYTDLSKLKKIFKLNSIPGVISREDISRVIIGITQMK